MRQILISKRSRYLTFCNKIRCHCRFLKIFPAINIYKNTNRLTDKTAFIELKSNNETNCV